MKRLTKAKKRKLKREYWLDIPGHPSYFNLDGLINFTEESDFECIDMEDPELNGRIIQVIPEIILEEIPMYITLI